LYRHQLAPSLRLRAGQCYGSKSGRGLIAIATPLMAMQGGTLLCPRARARAAVRDTLEEYKCWDAITANVPVVLCGQCFHSIEHHTGYEQQTSGSTSDNGCVHDILYHEDCLIKRAGDGCQYGREDIQDLGEAGTVHPWIYPISQIIIYTVWLITAL